MKKLFPCLCLFLLLFCSCGKKNDSPNSVTTVNLYADNVLTMKASTPVTTIDPAYVSTETELLLAHLLFSGPLKKVQNEIEGDLVFSWEISPDQLLYTFHLKQGICFNDGSSLTANDIAFSWERALRIKAPNAYLFYNIVGADKILNGESRTLDGFTAIDDTTFSVQLVKADSQFLSSLCNVGAFVLKKNELLEHGENFAHASSYDNCFPLPSGSGPMKISEWLADNQLCLTTNDNYYGTALSFRRLELKLAMPVTDALLKLTWGELGAVQGVLPSEVAIGDDYEKLPKISNIRPSFMFVMLNPTWSNVELTPLAEKNNRLAIMQQIDAAQLCSEITENLGLTGTGLTEFWYSISSPLQTMRDYTSQGDYKLTTFLPTLPIICGISEKELATAQSIAKKLSALDIKTEIRQLSYASLLQAVQTGEEIGLLIYEFNDRGGGLTDFFKLFIDGNAQNILPTEDFQSLIDTALTADSNTQKLYFQQIEKIICEEGFYKVLWFNTSSIVYNPKIRGVEMKLQEFLN